MYTHHEDHDIFVCDICEAIMVTEEAIGEHLKMKHREEIRRTSVKIIPDSERDVEDRSDDVNEDEVQMEVVLENPNLDLKYVNKQFYVCQKCDDIFLDPWRTPRSRRMTLPVLSQETDLYAWPVLLANKVIIFVII